MKIGYDLINSPFVYNVSYLNGNLNCEPPGHKSITLFGTLSGVASKSTWEIKLSVPVDDSEASGFDNTFKVAKGFDDIIFINNLYIISIEQLCSTYQNYVLKDADYHTFWSQAMEETTNIKNDNETYKPDALQQICNAFFNKDASNSCPVAAGDSHLNYMHIGNKKPQAMSPQTFYIPFQGV